MNEPRRRRWRHPVLVVGAVTCAVALAAAGGVAWGERLGRHPAPTPTGPAATAEITRTTLSRSVTFPGVVTHGAAGTLTSAAAGMLTWLPDAGTTLQRGAVALRANDLPVVLIYGQMPVYRPLALNTEGNDVFQFERNLARLGYHGFSVDRKYSAATVTAVRRWQSDLGRPETGTVDANQVVVAPGPLRVSRPLVKIGASAAGEVLSYTDTVRMISLDIPSAQAGWVRRGAPVTVRLSDGRTVAAKVDSFGAAAAPSPSGEGSDAEVADGGASSTGASSTGADVPVLVRVADQDRLDDSPAERVEVTRLLQQRRNVLTVPVQALLALAEGGYGLELVTAPTSRVVAVKPGMFADGRVEVTGAGLTAGQRVGVPA